METEEIIRRLENVRASGKRLRGAFVDEESEDEPWDTFFETAEEAATWLQQEAESYSDLRPVESPGMFILAIDDWRYFYLEWI